MRKVRKSWAPGREVEVPEHDYVDLLRQGLLVDANGGKVTKSEPLPQGAADSNQPDDEPDTGSSRLGRVAAEGESPRKEEK